MGGQGRRWGSARPGLVGQAARLAAVSASRFDRGCSLRVLLASSQRQRSNTRVFEQDQNPRRNRQRGSAQSLPVVQGRRRVVAVRRSGTTPPPAARRSRGQEGTWLIEEMPLVILGTVISTSAHRSWRRTTSRWTVANDSAITTVRWRGTRHGCDAIYAAAVGDLATGPTRQAIRKSGDTAEVVGPLGGRETSSPGTR